MGGLGWKLQPLPDWDCPRQRRKLHWRPRTAPSAPNKSPAPEERACLFSPGAGRAEGVGVEDRKQNFKAVSPFVTPSRPHPHAPSCIPEPEGVLPWEKSAELEAQVTA